ncbi:MAG: phosphatase PAP2 family protein, partial [Syntrophomonadaceae bacterium]|nr:phosphatase PAP2 family protein [Syntrophomonadaceae bacterium]
ILLVVTWVMVNGLKVLFARNRPPEDALAAAYGYSLPSGHAMLSLSFYGFLAYLLMRKWPDTKGKAGAALLAGLILLVGISRSYLNVHYVSDILAGYFFGAILLMLFIKGLDRVRKNIK